MDKADSTPEIKPKAKGQNCVFREAVTKPLAGHQCAPDDACNRSIIVSEDVDMW